MREKETNYCGLTTNRSSLVFHALRVSSYHPIQGAEPMPPTSLHLNAQKLSLANGTHSINLCWIKESVLFTFSTIIADNLTAPQPYHS